MDTTTATDNTAYRHSWDGKRYFYYHQRCVVEHAPPDDSVTFEQIPLNDVPQGVQCDFCYQVLRGE